MQFTVPTEQTVMIRKRPLIVAGIQDWPLVSIEKVFAYGLQQLANDAAAPAKNEDEVLPLVEKRLDNLRNGVLRASPIRTGNPVAVAARAIAVAKVTAAWQKKYGAKPGKADRDTFNGLVTSYAEREDVVALAKANVAAAAELDVDIEV